MSVCACVVCIAMVLVVFESNVCACVVCIAMVLVVFESNVCACVVCLSSHRLAQHVTYVHQHSVQPPTSSEPLDMKLMRWAGTWDTPPT